MQAVRRVPPPSRWLAVAGHVRVSPPPPTALECFRRRWPRSSISAAARASPPSCNRRRALAAQFSSRYSHCVSSARLVGLDRLFFSRRAVASRDFVRPVSRVWNGRNSCASQRDRFRQVYASAYLVPGYRVKHSVPKFKRIARGT